LLFDLYLIWLAAVRENEISTFFHLAADNSAKVVMAFVQNCLVRE
jgi:hypothetical protein